MKHLVRNALKAAGYRIVRDKTPLDQLIPEIDGFQRTLIETSSKYSMTGPLRLWAFMRAIEDVAARGIPGDLVECGVWKGGNLVLAGLMRQKLELSTKIWGFDTFEGMSTPTEHDRKNKDSQLAKETFDKLDRGDHNEWCYAAIDEVRDNFKREVGDAQLQLVKGRVEDTLRDPANLPDKISVLRLDTDWYESTKVELEVLYPRLVDGGVLIIDDYGEWAGAKQAVDEYFKGRPIWLHYVDPSCRLMLKPSA
ncbi:MAG: macrocin O-methyltransferase [Deltaproteobacteria bacterium]|nr:macrocin O-methyltransferase [Deltaproteobacteria bacterium]